MNRYVTEFVGTFLFVLVIGLVVLADKPLAALAIGSALMVVVYMGGHISGGHYNPAVSLALMLRGKLASRDLVPYVAAQLLGAMVATVVVQILMGQTFAPQPSPDATAIQALLVEVVFTFALALVVLNVATHQAVKGNSFFGLAIGFTVFVGAYAGGSISGGAFNPAVGVGPTLVHAMLGGGTLQHLWLYIVGPLAGGALAAAVYGVQET